MPRRHSMSWAHNSLDEFPTETPPRRLPPSQAAPFGHCPTYTKIIKSRLSSRSVENLWINKIFDFSRIFFGLTLNHVILQNMNMVSQATYLIIQFWAFHIRLGRGSKLRSSPKWTVVTHGLNCLIGPAETDGLKLFQPSISDLFRRSYVPDYKLLMKKCIFISIDYIRIVPNLGINLRIMFSENVMDDDLWFELFMIVKI